MAAIATVTGTALAPGVSRNKRLYTPELIGKAVARARERIAEGAEPLTMRTFHPEVGKEHLAPVTEIVGRVVDIWQEPDGRAKFRAEIANTTAGRDVAALVDNRDGQPYLRGVSIRGGWLGRVRREVTPNGDLAETAEDLELSGLDLTHKPGVTLALIDGFDVDDKPAESDASDTRTLIYESVQEALVTSINEADAPAAAGGPWADPGYQKDGKKRYDLGSKAKAKAAWSYINQASNARFYSSAQLKRIKTRIVKALKGFGVTVEVKEGWLIDHVGAVSESVAEAMGYEPNRDGSFCISLTNGPVTVNISSYCIDPHDLDAIGRAAMAGAVQALVALDPDLDGDIDVAGAPAEDNDTPEAAPAHTAPVTEADTPQQPAPAEPAPTAPEPVADPQSELEELVSEPTTPAVEPTPATTVAPAPVAGITFTDDQFKEFLDRLAPVGAGAPAEAAPAAAAPVAEATTVPVVESEDARIARLVAEAVQAERTKWVQETVEKQGPPQRKGLVTPVGESDASGTNAHGYPEGWPDKPLHQYTEHERAEFLGQNLVGAILKGRGQQA